MITLFRRLEHITWHIKAYNDFMKTCYTVRTLSVEDNVQRCPTEIRYLQNEFVSERRLEEEMKYKYKGRK